MQATSRHLGQAPTSQCVFLKTIFKKCVTLDHYVTTWSRHVATHRYCHIHYVIVCLVTKSDKLINMSTTCVKLSGIPFYFLLSSSMYQSNRLQLELLIPFCFGAMPSLGLPGILAQYIWYCIVLYCIVLYCIVLYCIALHCVALRCVALHCIVLYSCMLVVPPSISTCCRRARGPVL